MATEVALLINREAQPSLPAQMCIKKKMVHMVLIMQVASLLRYSEINLNICTRVHGLGYTVTEVTHKKRRS